MPLARNRHGLEFVVKVKQVISAVEVAARRPWARVAVALQYGDEGNDGNVDKHADQSDRHDQDGHEVVVVGQDGRAARLRFGGAG